MRNCSPETAYSFRFTIVHSVFDSTGHRLAKTPCCKVGVCGSQSRLIRSSAKNRWIVIIRRIVSPSRDVIPFQIPQTFSQLSIPMPLKNADCNSCVLSRDHRLQRCTMCRGSTHLYRLIDG